MSINKQGILNELGNVVNKLQSADCGCPQLSGGCEFGGPGGCSGGCCHGRGGNFAHAGGELVIGNCNPTPNYGGNPMQEVNYMQGGNSMQEGNAVHRRNAMPGRNSMEGVNASNANPNMPQSMANPNMQQGMAHANPGQTGRQIASASLNYEQHTEGIQKLSEMFPTGVISGDLGFDPMAIAVQMNPENKKIAAIYQKNQMKKMMGGNKGHLSNNLADTNATTNFAPGNSAFTNQQNYLPSNHETLYGQPGSHEASIPQNKQYNSNMHAAATPAYPNPQQVYYENNRAPQQPPVYTAVLASNQEQVLPQQQDRYQQQKMVDPNVGVPLISPVMNQEAVDGQGNTTELAPESQLLKKGQILPVDISRQMVCEYNTLGQPVHFLPPIIHSIPKTHQPQTLSPQPASGKFRKDLSKHHVKSIISKTSLMSNRPVGSTPSRSQLQSVYHQYKGSHSNTQQHIANPAGQSNTYSEGQLSARRIIMNQARQAPVETVGGDTAANNKPSCSLPPVNEQPIRQLDDVPAFNKHNANMTLTKEPPKTQGHIGKLRNGLQDKVFSTYPTFAGWSFHGRGKQVIAGYQNGRRPWL